MVGGQLKVVTIDKLTLGSVISDFFDNDPLTLYCPGLGIGQEDSYEEVYREIIRQIQEHKPGLKIKTIGIALEDAYTSIRGNDFDEILVGDIFSLRFNGVLFLPQHSSWMYLRYPLPGMGISISPEVSIKDYLERVDNKNGGLILYCLKEQEKNLILNHLNRISDHYYELYDVDSKKYGPFMLIKK